MVLKWTLAAMVQNMHFCPSNYFKVTQAVSKVYLMPEVNECLQEKTSIPKTPPVDVVLLMWPAWGGGGGSPWPHSKSVLKAKSETQTTTKTKV